MDRSMDLQCSNNKKTVQGEKENGIDFVKHYDKDIVFTIFSYLDDVADIHRARTVSRLWRSFVLNNANDLYLNLCFKKAPGMRSTSVLYGKIESHDAMFSPRTSEFLEDTYKVYSSLLKVLSVSAKSPRDCLKCVLGSSSTNRYPEQSIVHILRPEAKYKSHDTYWSSRGVSDSKANESILLELDSSFCIVTEIGIHPYKAPLEPGNPIYSPRFVRFQMGRPKLHEDENVDLKNLSVQELDENKYAWTYMSQEFPVIQDDRLQRFKLQEPVICVGGILKIELLGRAQRNEQDRMYYTCINHIKVLGHPLSPAFEVSVYSGELWDDFSIGDLCFTFSTDDINPVLQRITLPEKVRANGLEQDEREEAYYSTAAKFQIRSLMELLFPDDWEDPWDVWEAPPWDDLVEPWDGSDDSGDDLEVWDGWDLL